VVLAAILLLAAAACPAQEAEEPEPFLTIDSSDFIDWCEDTYCFRPAIGLYYNRVDGLLHYLGVRYRNDERLYPRFRAIYGWTSARGEGYHRIDFEQPLLRRDGLSVGLSLYEMTDWSLQDAEAISDFGNNVLALIARLDRRDYFRRSGATYYAQFRATPELTLRLEFRDDELASLETQQSVWSAFRGDEDWDENPPLRSGELNASGDGELIEGTTEMVSYYGSVVYDGRDPYERSGWMARWAFELAEGGLGGDHEFRQHRIDVRRLFPVTDTQTLSVSGAWGTGTGSTFPSHKLFYLGGGANLRGYEWKEFRGRNMLFARAEYDVRMLTDLHVIYFVDSGAVWYEDVEVPGDLRSAAGIGLRFDIPGVGEIRLDLARAATTEEADIMVDLQFYY
jgi:outer membrane protein assembly factor BamA